MSDEKAARIFAFDRVDAYMTPENQTIVEWRVNPRFEIIGVPLVFFVEFARTGGEWTRIAGPLRDVCAFIDTAQYRCGFDNDIYYRVVASDGTCEYPSRPAHTMGEHSRRDLLLAREVLRKEYLRLRKFAGTAGFLLKRREYGQRCTNCTDYDTGEVVSGSTCTVCFGTGFVRGYYNALPAYIDFMGPTSTKDVKEPFGVEDNQTVACRGMAYPRLDTYDIWVHGSANRRFVIRQTQVVAEIRTVPVMYSLQMRMLPATDIAYQVPMLWEPSSSSSSSSAACAADAEQGWRKGIAYQEVW